LVRIQAATASELIEIDREPLMALVKPTANLAIFFFAPHPAKTGVIARGISDLVLIGSSHSLDTLRIKEFLTRNYQPYLH